MSKTVRDKAIVRLIINRKSYTTYQTVSYLVTLNDS